MSFVYIFWERSVLVGSNLLPARHDVSEISCNFLGCGGCGDDDVKPCVSLWQTLSSSSSITFFFSSIFFLYCCKHREKGPIAQKIFTCCLTFLFRWCGRKINLIPSLSSLAQRFGESKQIKIACDSGRKSLESWEKMEGGDIFWRFLHFKS